MPRLNRRTKVVSIRLSGNEYDEFMQHCIAKGADSISEFARRGMKLLVNLETGVGATPIESRVNEIHVRVTAMDREIGRLSKMMGITRLELETPRTEVVLQAIGETA